MQGLGNQLKKLRNSFDLTQKELCEKLNFSRSTYNGYEHEISEPELDKIIKLADFFGVSIDYLLGHEIYNKKAGEFYQLTEEQKELIPLIKKLDMLNCSRVKGYLENITNENSSEEEKLI